MGGKNTCCGQCMSCFARTVNTIMNFVCTFLEIHSVKIVAFVIMCYCCYSVCALNMIVVFLLVICLLFGTSSLRFSFLFIGPYLGILFITKMVYQTKFFPELGRIVNCSDLNSNFSTTLSNTVSDPIWWGFETLQHHGRLVAQHQAYIFVIVVMTLQSVIRAHQKIKRIDANLPKKTPPVMYIETTRKDADGNLRSCLKYLLNYGFYKFGIEITLTYCVFVIGFREDAFSVLYALWVLMLILPKRTTISVVWPFFLTTLLFSVLWQYIMAVGLSKNSCFVYPWDKQEALVKWLFLPNFKWKPNTIKTLVDFVLLLLLQRQQRVFELEKRYGTKYLGGSNKEDYLHYYSVHYVNPCPNHTLKVRSWIEVLKKIFVSGFFKITLAVLLGNGIININILSLGYLVISFIYLWIDNRLCLWNIKKILRWWNVVLLYTTFVVVFKATLKFIACIYGKKVGISLFYFLGIYQTDCCDIKSEKHRNEFAWDLACFFCVIIQKRIFKSCYFLYEVDEVVRTIRLQAMGAKIMDTLQDLRVREFKRRERKTLNKIKKHVIRIKAWQKRIQGMNYIEPKSHEIAIYSGDYFMFEDNKSESTHSSSSSDDEEEKGFGVPELLELTFRKLSRPAEKRDSHKPVKSDKVGNAGKNKNQNKDDNESGQKSAEDFEPSTAGEDEDRRNAFYNFCIKIMVFLISVLREASVEYRYMWYVVGQEKRRMKGETISKHEYSEVILGDRRFKAYNEDKDKYNKMNFSKVLVILLQAISDFFMSKTELICYLTIFLNTLLNPSFLTLGLPLMVLLWGSLTSVRPTTTFWTVMIAYTEIIVVIQGLFRNPIFPWNPAQRKESRINIPNLILGNYEGQHMLVWSVTMEMCLLLLLFMHRHTLRALGLWNRTHEEETNLPQDLKIYQELLPEKDLKNFNRGFVSHRKILNDDDDDYLEGENLKTPYWKCTSRATAKVFYKGQKLKTKVLVKEIEGDILVTHEGRRLQPTRMHIAQMTEMISERSVVLRVFDKDIQVDDKNLTWKLAWLQHVTPLRKFFLQILVRDWRMSTDYYTIMFICQFINFFIIFFFYNSFVHSLEVQADDYFSLSQSQVPPFYICAIILHFMFIIIDRILYLRKCIIGKLITQFILVIFVHSWMFIVIPIITEEFFSKLAVRQIYYLISCLYFLMSAYQLRVGYPMRVQGHFLVKKFGYFNFYTFVVLRMIPYFNQIRTLLDYLCISTSLSLMQWIRLESIFEQVFEIKCSRRADIEHPAPRGKECPKASKYSLGTFLFSAIIVIIWLPFIIFAIYQSVAEPNLPHEGILKVEIGNFGNIFTSTASFNEIITFSQAQYSYLQKLYKNLKKLWIFLSLYDHRDVGVLRFRFRPDQTWNVVPSQFEKLNKTIQNLDKEITIYFVLTTVRRARSLVIGTARGYTKIVLKKKDASRQQLADAFLNKETKVRLNHALSKFVHITNEGNILPQAGFMSPSHECRRNVTLSLQKDGNSYWWKIEELADDPKENRIRKIPHQNPNFVTIYTFNEKNTPKFLLDVRRKGILGLYISIVFFSWTFVRRAMCRYPTIMFTDLPNPDPVFQLIKDIYLARESEEFALEEDLYAKLLFLFRSPETMIKISRFTEATLSHNRIT